MCLTLHSVERIQGLKLHSAEHLLFGDRSFICVVFPHLVDCPTVCVFDSDVTDWSASQRTEYVTTSQPLLQDPRPMTAT